MHSKKVLLSSQAFRHFSLEARYEAQSVEQYILFIRISAENPQMPASKCKKLSNIIFHEIFYPHFQIDFIKHISIQF